jgi:hypothetical protein
VLAPPLSETERGAEVCHARWAGLGYAPGRYQPLKLGPFGYQIIRHIQHLHRSRNGYRLDSACVCACVRESQRAARKAYACKFLSFSMPFNLSIRLYEIQSSRNVSATLSSPSSFLIWFRPNDKISKLSAQIPRHGSLDGLKLQR